MTALSALTDVADGKIARRFSMVSDFGKLLAPVSVSGYSGTAGLDFYDSVRGADAGFVGSVWFVLQENTKRWDG